MTHNKEEMCLRRFWLLATAASLAVAVGVGGATLALFSATSPNSNNQFTAGTVAIDAQRDMGDGIPGPMYYVTTGTGGTDPNQYPTGYLAPGDGIGAAHTPEGERLHRILQVENVGTLDVKLTKLRATLQSGSKYLADKLNVKVTTDPDGLDVIASGTVGSFIDADQTFSTPIEQAPTDMANLHFWVEFPLDANNSYQGLTAVVSFTVYAEQLAHNP
ncbi:MAG: hypothetical protein K0R39_2548 [Symbiobacteriaceae bacterium]|jgi:predicted ribosomally synthesized peptide with SipW-like signal peptide|nr:hypothetical protein [Symbiobacteriaceae bacterium]